MATGSVRADCGSCFTYCTCCAVLQMPMKEGHEAANALLAAALDEACSPFRCSITAWRCAESLQWVNFEQRHSGRALITNHFVCT